MHSFHSCMENTISQNLYIYPSTSAITCKYSVMTFNTIPQQSTYQWFYLVTGFQTFIPLLEVLHPSKATIAQLQLSVQQLLHKQQDSISHLNKSV